MAELENKAAQEEEKMPNLLFNLEKPFMFEGEEVKSIDLNGLYNFSIQDMYTLNQEMYRLGFRGSNLESTLEYCCMAAALMNNKPYEWLYGMGVRDAIRFKNTVNTFFYAKV